MSASYSLKMAKKKKQIYKGRQPSNKSKKSKVAKLMKLNKKGKTKKRR